MSQPVDPGKRAYISSHRETVGGALINIRTVINVFSHLNDPDVHDRWVQVFNATRPELDRADTAWVNSGNQVTHIARYGNDWISKHIDGHGATWEGLCADLSVCTADLLGWLNDDLKTEVLTSFATLRGYMNLITVDFN